MDNPSPITMLILARIIISTIVAYGILTSGIRIARHSKVPRVARAMMFLFISMVVHIIALGLISFLPEVCRQGTSIITVLLQGGAVMLLMNRLSENA